jgi:Arc/MetJ family transcription regulator
MGKTTVEIDSDLLARLRRRHPGKDDRTLIEDLVRRDLEPASRERHTEAHTAGEEEATRAALRDHDDRQRSTL